jgi:ribose transport system permease protein
VSESQEAVATQAGEALRGGFDVRRPSSWHRLVALQVRLPILQVLILVALFAYGALTLPGLATWPSAKLILYLAALTALAGIGQTMLILMGGFDLSVPGFIVAGTMVVILPQKFGISFGVAVLILMAFAGFIGILAGQICHRLALNPLIVTLATGAIATGTAQVIIGAGGTGMLNFTIPIWLRNLASPGSRTFGINVPPAVAIAVVAVASLAIFLHGTVVGARLLAAGANMRAAEYSLVRTRRIWTATFAFSAIASTLVGMLLAGYGGSTSLEIGDPYLFLAITAVFVGGTVFGGPGDFTRTAIGALFLEVLTVVLIGHGVSQPDQQILYGLILLLAVIVYGRADRLRDRV